VIVVTNVPGDAISETEAVYCCCWNRGTLSLASAMLTITVAVEDKRGFVFFSSAMTCTQTSQCKLHNQFNNQSDQISCVYHPSFHKRSN
jgi:hypothetical protein